MEINTCFTLGDVVDFSHSGKFERIRVDEIKITISAKMPKNHRLIEYREHKPSKWHDGSSRTLYSKWWPEAWLMEKKPNA